jgi:hypothetical protein
MTKEIARAEAAARDTFRRKGGVEAWRAACLSLERL